MKLPWYIRPSVVLTASLGGFFTVLSGALAQPWAATTAPVLGWTACAMSGNGWTLAAAGCGNALYRLKQK